MSLDDVLTGAGAIVIIAGFLPGMCDLVLAMGLGNLIMGAGAAIGGLPHRPWAGAVNVVLGVALLWYWWNKRGGRDKARKWLGAKSAAMRAVLVRRMREAAQPA